MQPDDDDGGEQLLVNRPPLKLPVASELHKAGHVVVAFKFFRENPTFFEFESQIVTTVSLRCSKTHEDATDFQGHPSSSTLM